MLIQNHPFIFRQKNNLKGKFWNLISERTHSKSKFITRNAERSEKQVLKLKSENTFEKISKIRNGKAEVSVLNPSTTK